MADGFYVEVWQLDGQKAELYATVDTFDAATAWLRERRAEDERRLPRILGLLDDDQKAALARMGLGPG